MHCFDYRTRRLFLILPILLAALFVLPVQGLCKQQKFTDLYENMSYDVPGSGELTKQAIENLSFKIQLFGSFLEGNFVENPPYTLVKFTNGAYEKQSAEISLIATGTLGSTPAAALLLSEFDGGNGEVRFLCIVTKTGKDYHINQAAVGSSKLRFESLELKGDKLVAHVVYHGPQDPGCCPTQKGSFTVSLKKNKLVY